MTLWLMTIAIWKLCGTVDGGTTLCPAHDEYYRYWRTEELCRSKGAELVDYQIMKSGRPIGRVEFNCKSQTIVIEEK